MSCFIRGSSTRNWVWGLPTIYPEKFFKGGKGGVEVNLLLLGSQEEKRKGLEG